MTHQDADMAYRWLHRQILMNHFEPGQALVTRVLAAELHISTTPVRDALKRLESEGLVWVKPRSGCIVAPITFKLLNDILWVREATSPACARLATIRATDEELEQLGAFAEGRYADASNVELVMSASHRFHSKVARLTQNDYFIRITDQTLEEIDRIFSYCGHDPLSPQPPLDDHLKLVEAMKERDAEKAASIATLHLKHTRSVTLDLVMQSGKL